MDLRNAADTLIYTAEKALRDAGDKISAEIKSEIESKIGELKNVKDGSDTEAIKRASQELSTSLQKIGEVLYKQGAESREPKAEGGDNVKEAEFEEKKGE